jgi:transcriptional regulator with XRE-family HTH domain
LLLHGFLYVRKKVDTVFLKSFGNNLKNIRESKNITQAQLAIDCDFDVSVISRIERGVVNTSLSNLKLIGTALNIDLKELFDF